MRTGLPGALLGAAIMVALAAGPALSQDASSSAAGPSLPDEMMGYMGDWALDQDDDKLPKCPISLTDQAVAGGWAIQVMDLCPAPYPDAKSLVAWTLDDSDGAIVVHDADQKVVMRLLPDSDGIFDTGEGTSPRFYLLPPYDVDSTGGEEDGN